MAGAGAAVVPESILAGNAVEWEYGMRREMQEIIPNIFLGPYACAMKKKLAYLQEHHITHIVCVRQTQEAHFVRANFPQHFTYLVVDLSDGNTESIIPHFPQVRDFLKAALAAGGKVLMHGNAGISRGGALLVSFMMEQYGLAYTDALRLIQLRRFCVSPNEGFQAQLLEYEPIYQAAAMAAQGQLQRQARPKRGIDETDYDDDGEAMEDRNPAEYPPAIELPPLPGHGAYCGPEAVARQAAEKAAKQQAAAALAAVAAGGGGRGGAAGAAAATAGGTGRPNTAAALQAHQARQQHQAAMHARQQQQQHQAAMQAHQQQQQHAAAMQAQQQQQHAAQAQAHQQQRAMAMHAQQQQQQHAAMQAAAGQPSFAQQAHAAAAHAAANRGGGAGNSAMDSGAGL